MFKQFIKNEIKSLQTDTIKTLLKWVCWFTFAIFICTLQLFTSMKGMSKIPIVFVIVLAIEIFIYCIIYGKIVFNFMMFSFFFYIAYAFIATIFGTRIFRPYLFTSLFIILMSAVIFLFIVNFRNIKFVMILYIISAIILAIAFVYFYRDDIFSASNANEDRIGSLFGNVNGVGLTFSISILIISIYLLYFKPKIPIIIMLSFLILIFSFLVIKTGSRTSFLVSLISLVFLLIKLCWQKHKLILLLVFIGVIVVFVLIFTIPAFNILSKRLLQLFEIFNDGYSTDASVNIRLFMQIDGYQLWLKNIIFGYGSEGFLKYSSYGTYSHATLSEILVNYGVIGFLLFFSPFLIYLKKGKKGTISKLLLSAIIFCLIIPEFFGGIILYEKHFFVIIGIIAAAYYLDNDNDFFIEFEWHATNPKKLSFNLERGFLSNVIKK